jgi:hypothetical protein
LTSTVSASAQAISRWATLTLTADQARAVARACVAAGLSQLASSKGLGDPCLGQTPLFVTGGDVLEATAHDIEALRAHPALLHRKTPPNVRFWLATPAALPECPTPRPTGEQCDEYPFASTQEGGQFNRPSLKLISAADNSQQGILLNTDVYGVCGVGSTQPFFVLPVPMANVPTFAVCTR